MTGITSQAGTACASDAFEFTPRRLSQERVVRTKFDIHVFIVVAIMTSVQSINHVNKMMYTCMVRLPQGNCYEKINMTGITSQAGTACASEAFEFTPSF
jgi:hypothetical protein